MINKIKDILNSVMMDNHFLSLAGTVSTSAIGAVMLMICSRFLSRNDLGLWLFFTAVANIIEITKYGFINYGLVKFVSGTDEEKEKSIFIGSTWSIGLITNILIAIVCYTIYYFFTPASDNIKYILLYYPLSGIFNTPVTLGLSLMTAYGRFGIVAAIKMTIAVITFVTVTGALLLTTVSGHDLILLQLGSMFLASCIVIFMGWSGLQHILKMQKEKLIILFNFGKYSILTFLGASVLRSSDAFIIGLMMTNVHVAFYAIPLKFIEFVEIVIDSIANVAMPAISREHSQKKQIKHIFSQYAGVTLLLLVPLLLVMFFFAKYLILIFAGDKFIEVTVSVNVFKIFLIYCLVMVVDRFSGVTLDAINKPQLNSYKVLVMAIINIVGDVIAIKYFASLEAVAVVTIVNVVVGLVISMLFLRREINLDVKNIIPQGVVKIKEYYRYIFSAN